MKKKTSPTLVGSFVIGAIILAIGGLIIFGSGKFFKNNETYILFFGGNLAGLQVGAPVTFKGIKIGSVTKVAVRFDYSDLTIRIPVLIEIDSSLVKVINKDEAEISGEDVTHDLIQRGLKAKLKPQSLVTGQLYVELDFHPKRPVKLVSPGIKEYRNKFVEIPTLPSDIEEIQKKLKNLPIEEIIGKALDTLDGIERIVNSTQVADSLDALKNSLKNFDNLMGSIDREFPQIKEKIIVALEDIDKLILNADTVVTTADDFMKSAHKVAKKLETEIKPLSKSAKVTLKQATRTMVSYERFTSKDSTMGYKLYYTLDELSKAARSIRIFAEYLERHPESIIRGKEGR